MTKRVVIPMLNYYPDYPSGSVRLAFDEAVYLANLGHEVWVITQDSTHKQPEYAFRDNLHVLHYPSPKLSAFNPRRIQAHQKATQDLLTRYIDGKVDLLHGHTLLSYYGALTLYKDSAQTCYTVHSPVKLEMLAANRTEKMTRRVKNLIAAQLLHQIEYHCLKDSQVITSDSHFTKEKLGELHSPEIGKRVQVVPGWVDFDYYKIAENRDVIKEKFGWSLKKPVLFTLRRLVPRNGIDRLIKALKIVKDSGADFEMIIGSSGSLREQLETLTRDLDLADSVRFIGRVSDDDLPQMYAGADVFILPTAELECFGLIILESFAAGRPVLATPVAAIPEIMTQIEASWLSSDASVESIARLIIAYLNGELPRHEPNALRSFAQDHYHADLVIPNLIRIAMGN